MGFSAFRSIFGVLSLFVACIALSESAAAQPKIELLGGDAGEIAVSADGTVRHKAANFVFPHQIGDMPLRKVQIYGPADVSVDYTLRGGGNGDAWITLYIYPASHSLNDEVADVEHDLIGKWSATRIAAPPAVSESASDGTSGWFKGNFEGLQATTGYVLVKRGAWFLETRYTIPDAAGQKGTDRTIRALADVPWSWNSSAAKSGTPPGSI
jgi:hypothetical protein